MKKKYLFPLLLVLSLLGCSRPPVVVVEEPPQQDVSNTVILPASNAEEHEAISKAFADIVPGSTVTVRNRTNRKEVLIVADLPYDSQPDNWVDLCASLCAAYNQIDVTASARIEATDGTILVNSYDGRITYDHFNNEAPKKPNAPTISLEEYQSIKTGMTYQEVYNIIGSSGTELSSVDFGYGTETQLRMWDGEGSLGANANIMFQGGKVISKAQFGLG